MKNTQSIKSKNKLFRFQNKNDIDRYIIFYSTASNLILGEHPSSQKQNVLSKMVYREIGGIRDFNQVPFLFLNQKDAVEALKHTFAFGGEKFVGARFHDNFDIKLKMKHIEHISFKNLKILSFVFCKLKSIQVISQMDMPIVKQIKLQSNFIFSLKPLKKTLFTQINVIQLHSNQFSYHQLNNIQRMYSHQLKPISINRFSKYSMLDFELKSKQIRKKGYTMIVLPSLF